MLFSDRAKSAVKTAFLYVKYDAKNQKVLDGLSSGPENHARIGYLHVQHRRGTFQPQYVIRSTASSRWIFKQFGSVKSENKEKTIDVY